MKEEIKRAVENLTGIGKPRPGDLTLDKRKAWTFRFKDDGVTPNNPRLPLVLYRSPVRLGPAYDPAAIFESLFAHNGWNDAWRDGMYNFNHFHTATHEVLGIARGSVTARFGGAKGRRIVLKAGDVVVIPAGTGHRRLRQSKDLLIVGAYPSNGGDYNEPQPDDVDHDAALRSIARVRLPLKDPVFGKKGEVLRAWRAGGPPS